MYLVICKRLEEDWSAKPPDLGKRTLPALGRKCSLLQAYKRLEPENFP